MLALALTLHLFQPQIPHLRTPTLLADDAPLAPPPFQLPTPQATSAPLQAAPPDLHVAPELADPLAGSFSFAELGLGALGVIATTATIGLLDRVVSNGEDATFGVVSAVAGLIVTPLLAAAIASSWAGPNAAGSFGKALLRASLVEAGGLLLTIGVIALDPSDTVVLAMVATMAVIEFVGVPMAASYGAHAGPSRLAPAAPTESIRSEMPPLAQANARMRSFTFAFRF